MFALEKTMLMIFTVTAQKELVINTAFTQYFILHFN